MKKCVYATPLSIFFFNDTATTEIYTLSLHDALPISYDPTERRAWRPYQTEIAGRARIDRKSTRLNSSHSQISYAVFCLKKKHGIGSRLDVWIFYFPDRHDYPEPSTMFMTARAEATHR